MDVSIIMINYNTFELTKNAINSIKEYTKDLDYEIILIDNLSKDKSGDMLNDLFKDEITYIQSGGNLGTSKAFNIGAKIAKGKYTIWLNTDILIKENFIKKLFDFMEENPNCGICGGNIVDFDGNPTHSFKRYLPTAKTIKKEKNLLYIKNFKKNNIKKSLEYNYTGHNLEVGYITGADMMIRTSLFKEVGYFNERIFMYVEETDFTYRAKQKGYKVYSVYDAKMYHLEGASLGSKEFSKNRFKFGNDGRYIYLEDCYGKKEAMAYLKVCLKSYKKFRFIYKLFGKKKKVNEYNERIDVIINKINEVNHE